MHSPIPRPMKSAFALVCLISLVAFTIFLIARRPGASRSSISQQQPVASQKLKEAYGQLPLSFEANQGQVDRRVKYLARGSGYSLFLTPSEAVFSLSTASVLSQKETDDSARTRAKDAIEGQPSSRESSILTIRLEGANSAPTVSGRDELPGKSNYFRGNDPQHWVTGVSNFEKVHFQQIYSGIDLTYYGNQRQLEYDFVVAPASDPKQIAFSVEGADKVSIDNTGDLVLTLNGREVRQHKPLTYQEVNGERREIKSRYVLTSRNRVQFDFGRYDTTKPLVIDPVLVYQTYFGGTGNETGSAIAVDSAGEAFITGTAPSVGFPGSPIQGATGAGGDAFVLKLNAAGTAVVYASYFGGDAADNANAIAVDQNGNAYVAGTTQSFNFPTAGPPIQSTKHGGAQMIRSTDSGVTFSTPSLTGLSTANISGVAVHPTDPNTAIVSSFGGEGIYKTTNGGATWTSIRGTIPDTFNNAVAIDPSNPSRMYLAACQPGGIYRSTDGGATWSATSVISSCMNTVVVDGAGVVYAGGFDGQGLHKSSDGGVTWSTSSVGGAFSVPALALDPNHSNILYAEGDQGVYKSLDAGATWNVTGLSTGSPTSDDSLAIDPNNSQIVFTVSDAQLKRSTDGGASWTTISNLGLSVDGVPTAVMITPTNPSTIFVGSTTQGVLKSTDGGASWTQQSGSTDDVNSMAFAPSNAAITYLGLLSGSDAFVTKLDPSGSSILYSTYLGGGNASSRGDKDDVALSIAVDPSGNAYVAGYTDSTDFPTQNPLQPFGGQVDAFFARLDTTGSNLTFCTTFGGSLVDTARGIALGSGGSVFLAGRTDGGITTVNPAQSVFGGGQDAFAMRLNPSGNSYTIAYSTYLGGANIELANSIAVDPNNNAYIVGQTNTFSLATAGAAQVTKGTAVDAFLAKFDPNGSKTFFTYIGGAGSAGGEASKDVATSVAVDASGYAYVAGYTRSSGFPVTNSLKTFNATTCNGLPCLDPFMTKINPSGSTVVFSTLLGGDSDDQAFGIALDSTGSAYIVSTTSSVEFRPGSLQPNNGGGTDAFVTKLAAANDLAITMTDNPDPISVNGTLTYTLTVTNGGEGNLTGINVSDPLPANTTFVSAVASQGTCTGTSTVSCDLGSLNTGQSSTITIKVTPTSEGTLSNTASATCNEPEINTGNNSATQSTTVSGTAYTVNSTADTDDGACTAVGTGNGCTLREAINAANLNATKDTILFSIGSGPQTITPTSSLPNLTTPVVIDGTSQPGFAGQPIIEINGTSAGSCFFIPSNGGGSTIRGLVINRCNGHGISIDGNNNVIQGNYIGTNASGTATLPVAFSSIFINGSNNQIGGTTASARNVLSGNGHQGIAMTGSGNTIQGNYVGTNAAGTAALGGGAMFIFQGASNNMIGGTVGTTPGGSCTGACNLVSGNNGSLSINATNTAGATNNTVQGNFIGTNVTGTAAIPNNGQGVLLMGVSGNHVVGNLISGNSNTGVSLFLSDLAHPTPTANNDIRGNFIGTNSAGTAAIPNGGGGVEGHSGASNNTIGGTTAADRNLISGNNGSGVSFGNLNSAANGNFVYGNFIGTNAAGNARLPNTGDGVTLSGVSGNHIGGTQSGQGNLISGNNNRGITIVSASPGGGQPPVASDSNFVQGNLIGTNAAGTAVLNNTLAGVSINSSNNNLIGGTVALARNVISGSGGNGAVNIANNGTGTAGSNGNRIQGNFIGTDINGTVALGNVNGIALSGGSSNNQIGGDDAADGATDGVVRARNIIAGNNNDGINIGNFGGQANGNIIQGNYIGVNVNGTAAVPNNFNGVSVLGVNATQIGGTTAGAGNVISGNNQSGINLNEASPGSGQANLPATNTHIEGNFIGTTAAGTAALRNLGSGVNISGTNSSSNYVGGSAAGARNLIGASASNGVSINVHADGNFVLGNWIGVNSTGATALVTTIGGTNSFGNVNGVMISGSSNNQIGGVTAAERNVISGNAGPGVVINNTNSGGVIQSSGNRVQGNYIGLNSAGTDTVIDPTGGQKFGNRNAGISIGGAINNLIGGTATGAGNVISGSFQQGVILTNSNNVSASGNTIQGNILGTNVAMSTPLVNGFGIFLTNGASNNTIGGDDLADGTADGVVSAGNKIFASTNDGIQLAVTNPGGVITVASGNTIQGNLIGGSTVLRNGGNGINLNGALNNIVGGTTAGAGNIISFNGNNGVVVNCSNFSGVIACGVGNQIRQNSIFSNTNLGIRLNANGASTGNNNQASPVVSFVTVTGANTSAQGSLTSVANSQFTLEFFANDACDTNAGGAGEGQTYIGSAQVTTDGAGNGSFNATLNPVNTGKIITATATQTTNGTSRFSSCVIAAATTGTISGHTVDQTGAPLAGATVTLSGSQNATATTDAAGNYSFPNLPSSVSYTVTPSLNGITFYPASTTLASLPTDRTVNFTKAIVRYTITDLGALTPGPVSIGWDVNSAGQVTGWSSAVSSTNFKPFFYNNGTVTNLTPLGTGTNALAIALSDSGRVVGYSELTPQGPNGSFTGTLHGFFSDNGGALKEIGTLGGLNTQAWGVNDNGAVVGQSQLANSQTRPFLWRDLNHDGLWQQSEMIDLGQVNGSTFGRGFAINNNNVVVGNSTDSTTGFTLATLWRDDNSNSFSDPGELRALGNLGGANANASGVNDNAYVCGTSEISGHSSNGLAMQRAFLWHDDNANGVSDPGEMKNLGTLGGEFSNALRINVSNEIVGWSDAVGINTAHAMRWKNNFMLDLNAAIPQNSGWSLTEARGISDDGKITGYGTINGAQHAYLLTPAPLSPQTVTFDPIANKTYGNAAFTVSASASSSLPVTFSVVSGPATVSGNTVTITGAGSVTLHATQAGDDTYAPASADQTFTVAKVSLSVVADHQTRFYGAPDPSFTASYFGFVNGDTAASLSGSLTFTPSSTQVSPVGNYSITPSGLTSNNYNINFVNGTLTITRASSTTTSPNQTMLFPAAVHLVTNVTANSPSSIALNEPSSVTFTIKSGAITLGTVGPVDLVNGQATGIFGINANGAYTVFASFAGTASIYGSAAESSLLVGSNINPVPTLSSLSPASAQSGSAALPLTAYGAGFVNTSTVQWFNPDTATTTPLTTTFISDTELHATVPATLLAASGTFEVRVVSPPLSGGGGGSSNSQTFFVTDTAAAVTTASTGVADPSTGTASASATSPSGGSVTAAAATSAGSGDGGVTVAQYSGDPIGPVPGADASNTFSSAGQFFDVRVSTGSTFDSLTFVYANSGGTAIYWWTGTSWQLASNQSYNPVTNSITVTVTATTSPTIAQLTGTAFAVAGGPTVGTVSINPTAPIAIGSNSPASVNALFTDAGQTAGDTYSATVDWGDGQTSTGATTAPSNTAAGSVSATHNYAAVGIYFVKVKVTRTRNGSPSFGSATSTQPVVVFDPDGPSVNGAGWFTSPRGAYEPNHALTGKFEFNVDAKIDKKSGALKGDSKFTFKTADFEFKSTSYYSWLVVKAPMFQLRGLGEINKRGVYAFEVTAVDGTAPGAGKVDYVRIRVWDTSTNALVYDNQMNAAPFATPTTAIGGGNIKIDKTPPDKN